jgi:hypothetical protein
VPADQLGPLLTYSDGTLPIVVMTACYSAATYQDSAALAQDLLVAGAPVVVGMAGRVADHACRLFTQRFYEALLSGDPVEFATAQGRYAGMLHSANYKDTVDWAMATLFLRDRIRLQMGQAEVSRARQRANWARQYRTITKPTTICDRIDCLEAYQALMGGKDADRPRVLALKVVDREIQVKDPKYGKTRLLEETAALAVREGHAPCLVTFAKNSPVLQTGWSLALGILEAASITRMHFGLDNNREAELFKLKQVVENAMQPIELDDTVQTQIQFHPLPNDRDVTKIHGKVMAAALRVDLLALAADTRATHELTDAKVIVLVDAVHRFGQAAGEFVEQWLDGYGLGRPGEPVPVVFAFSAVAEPMYGPVVQALQSWIEPRPSLFQSIDLKAFPSPLDDQFPYHQLLLSLKPPRVLRSSVEDDRCTRFFKRFHEFVHGVPSRFEWTFDNEAVMALILSAVDENLLEEADDEKMFEKMLAQIGGKR